MIKIDKTITIDGKDVETLSNIMELARRHIQHHKERSNGKTYVNEYTGKEIHKMEEFMDDVW